MNIADFLHNNKKLFVLQLFENLNLFAHKSDFNQENFKLFHSKINGRKFFKMEGTNESLSIALGII